MGRKGMNSIGQPERALQVRVHVRSFGELKNRYLGDWTDRANSNVELDTSL